MQKLIALSEDAQKRDQNPHRPLNMVETQTSLAANSTVSEPNLTGEPPTSEEGVALLELDQALDALSGVDERQGKIVELKFFGGVKWP